MNDSIRLLRDECRKNIASVTQLYFDTYFSYKQIGEALDLKPSVVRDIVEGNVPLKQREEREKLCAKLPPGSVTTLSDEFYSYQVKTVMMYYNGTLMGYKEISAQPGVLVPLTIVRDIIHANTTENIRADRLRAIKQGRGGDTVFTYIPVLRRVGGSTVINDRGYYSEPTSHSVDPATLQPEMTEQQLKIKELLDTTTRPLTSIATMMGVTLNDCLSLASQVYTSQQLEARSKRLHYREQDNYTRRSDATYK